MNLIVIIVSALLGAAALGAASWKWCLPLGKATGIIVLGTILGLAGGWAGQPFGGAMAPFIIWAIQGAAFVGIVLWLFYRDPERTGPTEPAVIVSPADGMVIYVRELEAGEPLRSTKNGALMVLDEMKSTDLARQALWQVGISMVFTDVHVNRAPIAGKVAMVHHRPGRFLSLRLKEATDLNERQTLVIDNAQFQIGLVQIASRLVRQIVAYVSAGEMLERGQRVGMIRFGSQVDLFIPRHVAPRLGVSIGQRLVAGETMICRTTTPQLAGQHAVSERP